MRVKVLRRGDGTTVLLVHPDTLDEYGRALSALARRAGDGPAAGRAGHTSYVMTTAEQRHRWKLPDLAAFGGAPVVDEPRALALLREHATWPGAPAALDAPRDRSSAIEARRALATPTARLDGALGALGPRRRRCADDGVEVREARPTSADRLSRAALGDNRWEPPCDSNASSPTNSIRSRRRSTTFRRWRRCSQTTASTASSWTTTGKARISSHSTRTAPRRSGCNSSPASSSTRSTKARTCISPSLSTGVGTSCRTTS